MIKLIKSGRQTGRTTKGIDWVVKVCCDNKDASVLISVSSKWEQTMMLALLVERFDHINWMWSNGRQYAFLWFHSVGIYIITEADVGATMGLKFTHLFLDNADMFKNLKYEQYCDIPNRFITRHKIKEK